MTQETPSFDRHDQVLMGLVLNLQTSAMVQLGKITDPSSGELDRNLDAARMSIDLLEALKVKTAGHLPPEISQHLKRAVMDLQLNFADESAKEEAPGKSETPDDQPAAEEGVDEV